MIYVIRLIKRLSARNVRAYMGRANLRTGTGNGLCAHNGSARGSNAETWSSTGSLDLFFFSLSFMHRAVTRRWNTASLCSRLVTPLVVSESRHAAGRNERNSKRCASFVLIDVIFGAEDRANHSLGSIILRFYAVTLEKVLVYSLYGILVINRV